MYTQRVKNSVGTDPNNKQGASQQKSRPDTVNTELFWDLNMFNGYPDSSAVSAVAKKIIRFVYLKFIIVIILQFFRRRRQTQCVSTPGDPGMPPPPQKKKKKQQQKTTKKQQHTTESMNFRKISIDQAADEKALVNQ